MSYMCGVNVMWHNPLVSPMPWVPLYKSRVMALVKNLARGQFPHGLVLVSNFTKGANLSCGGRIRVSPDEWDHGSSRSRSVLQAGASDEERKRMAPLSPRLPMLVRASGQRGRNLRGGQQSSP